ncbi:MAG: alpha-L-glutamate ligase-like protein [Campylobacterota bacterium]|nr:alpha-L-glutamate ligase-like protein [Campylobacterota bacterium]
MFANPFTLKKLGILGMNKRNIHYIGEENDRKYYPLVDNKLKTKVVAQNAGIAVPKLLATIERQSQLRKLKDILASYDKFVIKPAQGSAGKGILVIVKREGDTFFKPNGQGLELRDIHRDISNILSGLYSLGGKTDVAMIEQLVEFDPIFDRYSYEGVPDIRVIIYKGYPAMAMLRCSTNESDGKANLHQGAVGVGIDMASGKALFAVQHGKPVTNHPDTGYDFSELQIPYWEKMLTLAASCYEVTHLGYLGVDIVLDKNLGPLILELNARPGLAIQIANKTGALKRFDKIDEQSGELNISQRVQFSMNNF